MSPYEKYMKEKRAFGLPQGVGDFAKSTFNAGAQGVGAGVAAAGVTALGLATGAIYGAITKQRDFRSMMEANPDLQAYHQQDPKRFNLMFTTLRNMNSSFSKDPLVAGTFMRRMAESPDTAGGIAMEAGRMNEPSTMMESFSKGLHSGVGSGIKSAPTKPSIDEMRAEEEMRQQVRQKYQPPERDVGVQSYQQERGKILAQRRYKKP